MNNTDLMNTMFSWYRGIVPTQKLSQSQVDNATKIIDTLGIETFASIISFDLKNLDTPADATSDIISSKGYAIIKQFEGFRSKAYLDTGGVWTIGYGTIKYPNGKAVRSGDTCTEASANKWMQSDCAWVRRCLSKKITNKNLSQNQYDALASFIYNVGEVQFGSSTLLNLINRKNLQGAASQFDRWVYDNGTRVNGLVNRRKAEKALFLS